MGIRLSLATIRKAPVEGNQARKPCLEHKDSTGSLGTRVNNPDLEIGKVFLLHFRASSVAPKAPVTRSGLRIAKPKDRTRELGNQNI